MQRDGQALLSATEAAVNACRNIGFGVSMSATNYSRAEAASTMGGDVPLPPPPEPATFTGPTMPAPFGPGVARPMLWSLVESFVGDVWPDGESGALRAAAAAWRTFGSAITATTDDLGAACTGVRDQDIPEGAAITSAVNQISQNLTALAAQCEATAGQLESFAGQVAATQSAIRDLLHRLSASGIAEQLGSIFTGHNPWDDIKQVAEDIKTVLGNVKRQADGAETMFQTAIGDLDSVVNSFEDWTRKEFVHYLGEDVGNATADAVNGYVDVQYGVTNSVVDAVNGLTQLDPSRFAYDPEGAAKTWGGAAQTLGELTNPALLAASIANDPDADASLDKLKALVSYDDWTSDHPLRGLGHNIGDVAQLFIPGVGEAKPATTAAGIEGRIAVADTRAASGAAREGASAGTHAAGTDIAAQGGKIADDLSGIKLPESAPVPGAGPGPSVVPDAKAPVDTPSPPETSLPSAPDVGTSPESAGVPETVPADADAPTSGDTELPVGPSSSAEPHEPPSGLSTHVEMPEHSSTESSDSLGADRAHPSVEHDLNPVHSAPQPLPPDSPLFDGYEAVDPGPKFTDPDGNLIYPNDSVPEKPYAVPGTVIPDAQLPAGTVVDRFGYPGGAWLSPDGIMFVERALPPDSALKPYFEYVVDDPSKLPPGWHIEQSQVAPWFDQPGGGVQYRIIAPENERPSVQTLIDWGYLKEARK